MQSIFILCSLMRSDYFTKDDLEAHCRCAGIFLTRDDAPEIQVLLVETHRKKYQFSFPKGKRNRGEDTMAAAKRELLEETGIDEDAYEILPGRWYIEYKQDCDKPHIVYYAARLLKKDVVLCPKDTKEILKADWYTPGQIYTMRSELYLQRRQIVTKAIRDITVKKLIRGEGNPVQRGSELYENFSPHKRNNGASTRFSPHFFNVPAPRHVIDPLRVHAPPPELSAQHRSG